MRAERAAWNRFADELDRAAVRLNEAEAAAQRRGLPGAVRPKQSEAFAAVDRKRQAAHDLLRAVPLPQSLYAQHRIGDRSRSFCAANPLMNGRLHGRSNRW